MTLNRELRRLFFGLLIAFAIVAAAAAYWGIWERDALLAREDNPRLVEARAAIRRGAIYDRTGQLLVVSEVEGQRVIRRYLRPETYSALGYYSLRYGAGGIESDFDTQLSGSTLPRTVEDVLLNRPAVGASIQVTFDSSVQRAVINAMSGRHGAVVVMRVQDGALLALASLPTFNPNTLDQDWERLREAPENPFFNRALQGRYQPGGAWQTPLLAATLSTGTVADEVLERAAAPVRLGNLVLVCAQMPSTSDLTFAQAYAYGCPAPFTTLIAPDNNRAFLMLPPSFPPAPAPTATSAEPPTPTPTAPSSENPLRDNLLGQGTITVNPVSMTMLVASIVNGGNAPQPYTLAALQPPDGTWQAQSTASPTLPIMTAETAEQLRGLMLNAVNTGAARAAARPDMEIGGHAAFAYAGDGALSWFVGFTTLNGQDGIAVTVVLENTRDADAAATIGSTALAAARDALLVASSPTLPQTGS
ncbi:MAG: penicillin-binding transpeptidase domain-containing protein [Chloroflexota bacterium]|nr:penicillin-binding transpeptidase domain-containing protein [Chloroflexota bacterium]